MALITDVLTVVLPNLASSNRYSLQITGTDVDLAIDTLCKDLRLVEQTRNEAEYWLNGIKYVIPREIAFTNEVSMTFIQDESENIREAFLTMMSTDVKDLNIIVTQQTNSEMTNNDIDVPDSFTVNTFSDGFVKSVSEIALSSSSIEIPEFTVSFGYNWVKETSTSSTAESKEASSGGSLLDLLF